MVSLREKDSPSLRDRSLDYPFNAPASLGPHAKWMGQKAKKWMVTPEPQPDILWL
ncbi:hypothetical protein ACT8ZS_31725 [Paenibacillus sp. M.A.Huq-84]